MTNSFVYRNGRSDQRLRIVVGGYLGLLPGGGISWDYVQYPRGFADLGHDVFYIEDTRLWPVFQSPNSPGSVANVKNLQEVMAFFGLADRWAYRDEQSGEWFGMSEANVAAICASADVLVNVSCAIAPDETYAQIPTRILIDSDPMFTQVQYQLGQSLYGSAGGMRALIDSYTHHFTFGENVGQTESLVPMCGVNWMPTRQPICLQYWKPSPPPADSDSMYTTVMNWSAAHDFEYKGMTWGQKNAEMMRFIELPTLVQGVRLAVAIGSTVAVPFPDEMFRRVGWHLLDPEVVADNWLNYATFITRSRGEVSVAKETYVKARTGWFSCRSACYLASGRPVVTQDTGWSGYLPTGDGLFAFSDLSGAVESLRTIERDRARHGRAARAIAEECFDARKVLGALLQRVGA